MNPVVARVVPVVMTVGIGKSSAKPPPDIATRHVYSPLTPLAFSVRRRDEHPLAAQDTCRNARPLLRPVQESPERSRPQKGVRRRQGGPAKELVQCPGLVTISGLGDGV